MNDTETKLLTLGITLACTPYDVHQGWIEYFLPSTTITDTWVVAGEVFGELCTQDTVMEKAGKLEDRQVNLTQLSLRKQAT